MCVQGIPEVVSVPGCPVNLRDDKVEERSNIYNFKEVDSSFQRWETRHVYFLNMVTHITFHMSIILHLFRTNLFCTNSPGVGGGVGQQCFFTFCFAQPHP